MARRWQQGCGLIAVACLSIAAVGRAEFPGTEGELVAAIERAENVDHSAADLEALMNIEALADRTIAGAPLPAGELATTRANIIAGYTKGHVLHPLATLLGRNGRLDFMRAEEADGERHLLFRGDGTSSLTYVTFVVLTRDGREEIVDYVPLRGSGRPFSETGKEMIREAVAKRAMIPGAAPSTDAEKMTAMYDAIRRRHPAPCLAAYATLSAEGKRDGRALSMRAKCAEVTSPAEYLSALDDWSAARPGDPVPALASVEPRVAARRYADALAAIDVVDAAVHDPTLDGLRGMVRTAEGKFAEAVKLERSALRSDPKSYRTWMYMLAAVRGGGAFRDVAEALDGLEREIGVVENVKVLPQYKAFRESPEYPAWSEARAARAATRASGEAPPGK